MGQVALWRVTGTAAAVFAAALGLVSVLGMCFMLLVIVPQSGCPLIAKALVGLRLGVLRHYLYCIVMPTRRPPPSTSLHPFALLIDDLLLFKVLVVGPLPGSVPFSLHSLLLLLRPEVHCLNILPLSLRHLGRVSKVVVGGRDATCDFAMF